MVASLLTFLLLSGCASLWDHEVYEKMTHLTQEDPVPGAAALTANSYDSLKNAVISVIRSGSQQESILVTDYPGTLTNFVISTLINEIQSYEPIGAYAVEYIAFDLKPPVLSQHTVTLNIVYKHRIRPAITPISGRRELEATVRELLRERRTLLTAEMPYFDAQTHDLEGMVRSFYYSNPVWAMEYPEMTVNLYPSGASLRRIVELELTWSSPAQNLNRKAQNTENAAVLLLSEFPGFNGDHEEQTALTVLWLHDLLCQTAVYDEESAAMAAGTEERLGGDAYTAYGALVDRLAVSEGYAMAFKLLCDALDIPCIVVTGRWWGDLHAWNLVQIGEFWYHIGVAFNGRGERPVYDFFLLDDEAARHETFSWPESHYPAALPAPWTRDTILDLSEEDDIL
jgi:hypothetical protein